MIVLKFIFCMIVTSPALKYTQAQPVNGSADMYEAEFQKLKNPSEEVNATKSNDTTRQQRQVVPSKWLRSDDDDDSGQGAQIAEQIMREADVIRSIVQQTLDAAIYAADPSQISSTKKSSRKNAKKSKSNQTPYVTSLLAMFTPEPAVEKQTNFMDAFRTLWVDFLENSKEMWAAMPPAETPKESTLLEEFQKLWLRFLETARNMLD